MIDTFKINTFSKRKQKEEKIVESYFSSWDNSIKIVAIIVTISFMVIFTITSQTVKMYDQRLVTILLAVAIILVILDFTKYHCIQIKQGMIRILLRPFGNVGSYSISSFKQLCVKERIDSTYSSLRLADIVSNVLSTLDSKSNLKEVLEKKYITLFCIEEDGVEKFKFYLIDQKQRTLFINMLRLNGIQVQPVDELIDRILTKINEQPFKVTDQQGYVLKEFEKEGVILT